ncbi:STAS-like domain-containing protein [Yersinia enterocolitica]|nr:STAS-like domain-containing protein [Yersinia enterocolitica]
MNKLNYKLPSGDLASRRLAIVERHIIEAYLIESKVVYLDLSGVESISESYADEIFGVLVVKYGVNAVLHSIKLENASPAILKSVAKVIQRRKHEVARPQNLPKKPSHSSSWATC